ncbi:protein kinase family protein [Pullulanibacillus sp. KACC 23026]|uniref:serine/threonine protein kinase n=1 Tax=Pullulanibacillus sp. KACC 23026 TaxID=3028315 RepID=UPI0023B1D22B|nr:protein kinase family protein [Pullulanibacillus sp. KACC 23026]WEG12715.1 protein kinase family protein [Pullulanibacillus sp. KACC 23026]
MEKQHTKRPTINISPGTVIHGKWHQNEYKIIRSLGFGAQGTVYLAQSAKGRVALKFGLNNATVTSEVNVLNKLTKVQGESLGPSLYDVDDWETNIGLLSFYAMEYLKGAPLMEAIQVRGREWVNIFILQLLKELHRLHSEGWVFGDLKPENLMVTDSPLRVRWLDVGGTTQFGRAIKEYTEFYDRGYWGLGSRKAEPSYDLFAVAMIMIEAAEGHRFERGKEAKESLFQVLNRNAKLSKLRGIIRKALEGQYSEANQMRQDLLNEINETKTSYIRINKDKRKKAPAHPQGSSLNNRRRGQTVHPVNQQPTQKKTQARGQQRTKKKEWKGTLILATTLIVAYVMYITLFVM